MAQSGALGLRFHSTVRVTRSSAKSRRMLAALVGQSDEDQISSSPDTWVMLRTAAIAKNMNASLQLPTATSVRAVPAKLLADNRIVVNNHLRRTRGGKVSFTHLLGYAMVQALAEFPNMNRHFGEDEKGKPAIVDPGHVNLGLAMDLPARTGRAHSSSWPSRAART